MEKTGVDGFLDSKEAKVSVLLLFSVLIVFVMTLAMSSIFVSGFTINVTFPLNNTWVTNTRVNFTFNSTWKLGDADDTIHPRENVSNCSLWYVSRSNLFPWSAFYNASPNQDSESVNISNASKSYFPYNFTDDGADDGNFTFSIACFPYNETKGDFNLDLLNFSANFTLQIDARGPVVNFTYAMGNTSFNTSNITTQKINFTVNDTGYGMNWSKNWTVNLTIYLGNSKMRVFNYTMVNGTQGLQCNTTAHPNIEGSPLKELVMCNATYQFSSNGTALM